MNQLRVDLVADERDSGGRPFENEGDRAGWRQRRHPISLLEMASS
jgi:hypothetical protein